MSQNYQHFDDIHWAIIAAARDQSGATPSYIAEVADVGERQTVHWLLQDLVMADYATKPYPGYYVLVDDHIGSDLDADHRAVAEVLRATRGVTPSLLQDRLDVDSRYTLTRRLRDLIQAGIIERPYEGFYILAHDPTGHRTDDADPSETDT